MLQSMGEIVNTGGRGELDLPWQVNAERQSTNQPSVLLLTDLLPFCSNAKVPKRRPRVALLPSPQRSSVWSVITCCKALGVIFAALV